MDEGLGISLIEANIRGLEKRIAQACERAGRSPADVIMTAVTKSVSPPAIKAAVSTGIVVIEEGAHHGPDRAGDFRIEALHIDNDYGRERL